MILYKMMLFGRCYFNTKNSYSSYHSHWSIMHFSPETCFQWMTLCNPMDSACQASLSITNSRSLLKLTPELVIPSNHLILCHPLLLPSILPSTRDFSNESDLQSGVQSIGASASASVLWMNIQDWSPLGLTGFILQSRRLSSVFSSTTVQKHEFFNTQFSWWSNSHIHTWLWEKP